MHVKFAMALLAGLYEKVLDIAILVLIISHSFGKKTDSDCERYFPYSRIWKLKKNGLYYFGLFCRRTSGCCEGFRFDDVLTKCVGKSLNNIFLIF